MLYLVHVQQLYWYRYSSWKNGIVHSQLWVFMKIQHRLALSRNILSRTLSPRMIVPLLQLYEADLQRRIETNDPSITPAEKKMFYKTMGILPPTNEKEVKMSYIGSTGTLIDTYVPTEGDRNGGAKEGLTKGTGKGKSFLAARKIRSYEDDFDQKTFLLQAQEIYIKAHKSLVEKLGRLIHGSEVAAKDVLEYATFERHLADYEEGEESSQTEVEVELDDEAIYDQHGNIMKRSS
ncbi:MRPL45 [Lepeophtheirus salmonis]|uniref:MRPL45 n=1 Tax=Lepeophtheirus salmonis TaxID=72036 RepID=A0A7R8H8L9_LEPSM|nr:MRPL45 [Lepeophtheirus salmonis]CAF2940754.1 MRPL45 [Lepeophtheirus salmonis]